MEDLKLVLELTNPGDLTAPVVDWTMPVVVKEPVVDETIPVIFLVRGVEAWPAMSGAHDRTIWRDSPSWKGLKSNPSCCGKELVFDLVEQRVVIRNFLCFPGSNSITKVSMVASNVNGGV